MCTKRFDIKPEDTSEEEINIFIEEEKRIFDNEIHYFDHPSPISKRSLPNTLNDKASSKMQTVLLMV